MKNIVEICILISSNFWQILVCTQSRQIICLWRNKIQDRIHIERVRFTCVRFLEFQGKLSLKKHIDFHFHSFIYISDTHIGKKKASSSECIPLKFQGTMPFKFNLFFPFFFDFRGKKEGQLYLFGIPSKRCVSSLSPCLVRFRICRIDYEILGHGWRRFCSQTQEMVNFYAIVYIFQDHFRSKRFLHYNLSTYVLFFSTAWCRCSFLPPVAVQCKQEQNWIYYHCCNFM